MILTVNIDNEDFTFEIADINKKTLEEMVGRSAYDRSIFLSLVVKKPKLMANEWYTQVPINIINDIVETIINYVDDIYARDKLSKTIKEYAEENGFECLTETIKYDRKTPQHTYLLKSIYIPGSDMEQRNYQKIVDDVEKYCRNNYIIDLFKNTKIQVI